MAKKTTPTDPNSSGSSDAGVSAAIAADPAPEATATPSNANISSLMNVTLKVQIVLGETRMPISQLLDITRGSVVELDKRIGEPVDMMINDRLVARGDLVKVDENRVGVNLTEITRSVGEL